MSKRKVFWPVAVLTTVVAGAFLWTWYEPGTSAQAKLAVQEDPGREKGILLWFREQESGVEPYTTRTIVTKHYMRMDDGAATGDFILLDRARRVIYSVTHNTRSILVIPYREVDVTAPFEMRLGEHRSVDPDAPKISGKQVVHYQFTVNDERCYDVMAVPGLLEDALAAMREFRTVLAGEHASNLYKTPRGVQRQMACDLAGNIFWPLRYLEHGFPIHEWGADGYRRMLIDYKVDYRAAPTLFVLPEGYERFSVSDLAGGT